MKYFVSIFLSIFLLSSCKVFKSNLMLKTPKNYEYDKFVDSLTQKDYIISPNDVLQYRILPNDGFKLVEISASFATAGTGIFIDVIISSDGTAKMPLVGQITLAGLSVKEAEKLLEEKFSKYYVNPFINLKVLNKRVIVFPGNSGLAKVIPVTNNNSSVMEVIASAGGITEDGKAYKVKLIRDNPSNKSKPLVYLMDLSTIDGITQGKSTVQANDIIYVEPRYRPFRTLSNEIGPVLTLITSVLILLQFYRLGS